jgi:hypothetical protein
MKSHLVTSGRLLDNRRPRRSCFSHSKRHSIPEHFAAMKSQLFVYQMVFAIVAVFSTGCSGTNQQSLSGNVTWQGKPIERGAINLFPLSSDGITVGSEIKNGTFSIDQQYGPTPGKYRVEVLAFRKTGKSEFDVDQNKQIEIEEQFLPRNFNQASKLETEIVGNKANILTLDLTPDK